MGRSLRQSIIDAGLFRDRRSHEREAKSPIWQYRVVSTKELLKGVVVKFELPPAEKCSFGSASEAPYQKYVQFDVDLEQGYLRFRAYGLLIQCLGKSVLADLVLTKKVFADEREFLFIDLFPSDAETATHQLIISREEPSDYTFTEEYAMFPFPQPLGGEIRFVRVP